MKACWPAGDASFDVPDHAQMRRTARASPTCVRTTSTSTATRPARKASWCSLRRAHAIGPLAQLDLERDDNAELIEAVIPNERFASWD